MVAAEKSRGELGELRNQLMRLSGGGSSPEKIAQKREVFRKVLMLGTIGQDMSSLFMQVRRYWLRPPLANCRKAESIGCTEVDLQWSL